MKQMFTYFKFMFRPIVTGLIVAILLGHSVISKASAITFIRDTEIENIIRLYTYPIFEAAGLDTSSVQTLIVLDDSLNAFVTGGQKIFINTGTLRHAELPEEVIGVLAHEAGHITGGHLAKITDKLNQAQTAGMLSMLIGVPLAVLSGRADVGLAASALGTTVNERDFFSYTRIQEQAADQASVEFMNKAGVDPTGLLNFMARLERQAKLYQGADSNPYLRTHPLTEDRMIFLRHQANLSENRQKKLPDYFYRSHQRMRMKLKGYVEPAHQVLRELPEITVLTKNSEADITYARAVALMRLADWEKAEAETKKLIAYHPEDPFYVELLGDIYRDSGQLEKAALRYRQVIETLPWAGLIRLSLAHVLIQQNQPELDEEALTHLGTAKAYEPNERALWRNLTIIYGRRGDKGMLALAKAESAFRYGDHKTASLQAEKAFSILPQQSSAWIRARDIYDQTQ